jgi:hypothetical protein
VALSTGAVIAAQAEKSKSAHEFGLALSKSMLRAENMSPAKHLYCDVTLQGSGGVAKAKLVRPKAIAAMWPRFETLAITDARTVEPKAARIATGTLVSRPWGSA